MKNLLYYYLKDKCLKARKKNEIKKSSSFLFIDSSFFYNLDWMPNQTNCRHYKPL